MGLAAILIELSQPAPVEILKIGVGAGEGQINVIEHRRIERARLARRAGHEPFGERRDRGGLIVVEERAMVDGCAIGVRMLVLLGERLGHQAGARNGPRAHTRAHQEFAARCIVLGHAHLLPFSEFQIPNR